ncbi:hypothetical protein KHQ89_06285 [Mycoplasmatota bacterium]|nr:hypothetical protein KHQ89_06285 [Mycoplasmatota bacterium]
MTNIMASVQRYDVLLDDESPQALMNITIDESSLDNGLIYLFIFEGIDVDDNSLTTDFYSIIDGIVSGYSTKADQLQAIKDYNMQALNLIPTLNIDANSAITFQIIAWGDYDSVDVQEDYLDLVFTLDVEIDIVNSKGDFS